MCYFIRFSQVMPLALLGARAEMHCHAINVSALSQQKQKLQSRERKLEVGEERKVKKKNLGLDLVGRGQSTLTLLSDLFE